MDWPNAFPTCGGRKQSPLLLPVSGAGAAALSAPEAKSTFSYGTLSNAKITNNGHTLLVSLPPGFSSDVTIPIKGDPKTATATSILNGKAAARACIRRLTPLPGCHCPGCCCCRPPCTHTKQRVASSWPAGTTSGGCSLSTGASFSAPWPEP
jgi:hypothetical protein